MMLRTFSALATAALLAGCATVPAHTSGLAALPAVGTVDPRFLSYNVEMVEVTGGRFWRPFGSPGVERHEYRPPLDLADRKLRHLAAALAPAYMRVSGTWANATWFADNDMAPAKAPAGFDTVLTHQQWRGVIEFAKASDAQIVTSFATSPGARDRQGVWQTDTAARWLTYTKAVGGTIAAAEFANEPNMVWLTQPPAGYSGADYRRDYTRFASWLKQASPETMLLAPGIAEIGEPARSLSRRAPEARQQFDGEDLIAADSPRPSAFSYHYYGGPSLRCGNIGQTVVGALSPTWLDGVDAAIGRVAALRDATAPSAPLWNTESGESACGGNPWASTFADSFRFIDTLGRSARQGVKVFIHNTLAASDYGLLDEHSYDPRPNYWAAILWKRTMGTTVLAAPRPPTAQVRTYAHCLPGRKGGVGLAVVNAGDAPQEIPLGAQAHAWLLHAPTIDSKVVTVNGKQPRLEQNGSFSGLDGTAAAGSLTVPGRSIAFVAVSNANNPACR
jgi:hypothetical protein